MKKILYKMLHILRWTICTPFVLSLGLITAPLSLIFGWKGFYILYIANQESCSFLKAKEILTKGEKYKIVSNSLIIVGEERYRHEFDDHLKRSRDFDERHVRAPR